MNDDIYNFGEPEITYDKAVRRVRDALIYARRGVPEMGQVAKIIYPRSRMNPAALNRRCRPWIQRMLKEDVLELRYDPDLDRNTYQPVTEETLLRRQRVAAIPHTTGPSRRERLMVAMRKENEACD